MFYAKKNGGMMSSKLGIYNDFKIIIDKMFLKSIYFNFYYSAIILSLEYLLNNT